VRSHELPLTQAERKSFDCTHAEVGAYLVGIWGLPQSIVETAEWHHLPSTSGARSFAPLTAVHAANALIGAGDFSHLGEEQSFDEKHLEDVGMTDRKDSWRRICEGVIWGMQAKAEVKA
jgi:HD-like signal output (HDOD) protein